MPEFPCQSLLSCRLEKRDNGWSRCGDPCCLRCDDMPIQHLAYTTSTADFQEPDVWLCARCFSARPLAPLRVVCEVLSTKSLCPRMPWLLGGFQRNRVRRGVLNGLAQWLDEATCWDLVGRAYEEMWLLEGRLSVFVRAQRPETETESWCGQQNLQQCDGSHSHTCTNVTIQQHADRKRGKS